MAVGTRAGVAYVDVKLGNLSGLTKQMTSGVDAAAKAAAAKASQEISKGIAKGASGIGGIKGPNINTSSVDRLKRALGDAGAAGRQLGKDLGVVGSQVVNLGRKAAGLGQAFIRPLKPVGAAINNYLLKPLASIASNVGTRISGVARGLGNALATPFRAAGSAAKAFASEVKGRFSSAVADAGARLRLAATGATQFGGRVRNMWTVAKQTSPVLGAMSGAASRIGGAFRSAVAPMGNVIASSGRLGASLGRVGAAFGGVARSAGGAVLGGLRNVGGAFSGLAQKASGFASSFRSSMSNVGQQLSTFSRKLGLTGFMVQNLGYTMTLAFTAPVAAIAALTFKLGGGLVNTMQNAKISFEAFTGSAKIATDTVQKLRKYATASPIFDTQSAITYAKKLMGVGVTMKDLFPSLNTIQYLTAKYGLTADETDGIVLAWTQTLSKGKAYSEELTQQMSEHGIPIWQILAKAFGVSQAKMHEMVKAGDVDAKSFQKAMIKVGQAGDFDKVIKAKANTFEGVWDRMKESVSNSLADAILKNQKPIRDFLNSFSSSIKIMAANAGPFVKGLASGFTFLGNALAAAANWFNKLPDSMKQTITNVVLLLAAAGPVVIIFGSLLSAVAGIAAGLSALATVLGAITLPMVAVAAAVALVVIGFVAMYSASKGFRDIVNGIIGTIGGLFKALGSAVIHEASKGFNQFREAVSKLWKILDNNLFPAIASIIKSVRDKLTPIWQKIGAIVGKVVSFAFARLADFVQKVLIPVVHFLTEQFKKHHDMIVNVIKIVGVLVGIIVGVLVGAIILVAAVFIGTLIAAILIVTAVVAGLIWFFGTGIPAAFNWCKKAIASVGNFFTTIFGAVWSFLKGIGAWFAGPFVNFFVSAGHAIATPFIWLWNTVLKPMWEAMKLAARIVGFVVYAAFLIIVAALKVVAAAFVWFYNKAVKPIFDAVARAANWLWVHVLYPAFNAIKTGLRAVGNFFLWVYNHAIKPAIDAVARAANWLWVHILAPAFNAIKNGFRAVGNFFLWVYNHGIKPAIDAVARAANWLWVHILAPAFNAIKAGFRALGNLFLWVYNHVIKPAFDAVGRAANWLWVHVLFPAFNAMKAGWHALGNLFRWVFDHVIHPMWNAMKAAINFLWVHVLFPVFKAIRRGWSALGDLVRSVWHNVIKPVWHAVQNAAFKLKDKIKDAFDQAKTAVTKVWNEIKGAVKKPVIAVIKFVRDGILGSIKKAADKFGFNKGKGSISAKMGSAQGSLTDTINTINKYAIGGPVRGPGSATSDSINARLSVGEHVWTAREVQAVGGQRRMMELRNAALRGQLYPAYAQGGPVLKDGVPGFRSGGYIPSLITKIAQKIQRGVRMSSGFRGGSVSLSGNSDYHSQGKAADLVSGNMDGLAAAFYKVKSYLLEEIHTRAHSNTGWYVKNGKAVGSSYYGAEVPVHRDHVHIAMNQGAAESLLSQLGGSAGKDGGPSLLDRIKAFAGSMAGGPGSLIDWATDVFGKFFKGPQKTLDAFANQNGVLGEFIKSSGHMLWDKAMDWFKDKIASITDTGGGGPGGPATVGGNVASWVTKAMQLTHAPESWRKDIYRIIQRESGGNPNAINNYDINAKNGIPSQGLMQTIPPVFKKYHMPGTSWNIKDPVANIAAAIRYIRGRYGDIKNTPYNYYDNGGWLGAGQGAINATGKPEMYLNQAQGNALERRIAGTEQPMHITINANEVPLDEGQLTAVMTRIANQRRYHRPN